MSRIRFGWAETDITPKQKISLAGEFFERVTDEAETPITATALAIECGGEQAVICSIDIVSIGANLVSLVKEAVKADGLDPEKIIICAPHIHNSYTYKRDSGMGKATSKLIYEHMPEGCRYVSQASSEEALDPQAALEFLVGKTVAVIEQAWANLKNGCFAYGFGRAAIGMNRRVCYSDGKAKMWGDVDTPTFTGLEYGDDNGVEMLFIYDNERHLTGIVCNVACPAQVMEQRTIISSDYWGKLKILLRQQYGDDIMLLPLCSAAGDLCPRDLVRWVEPETPIKDPNVIRNNPKFRRADPSMFDVKGTWKIGKRLLSEINMALEEVEEYHTDVPFEHRSCELRLPLRRVTESEYQDALQAIAEFFKGKTVVNYADSAALHIYMGIVRRYEVQKERDTVSMNVHYIRLGDMAVCTNPFELFVNYGHKIRARSAAAQTMIIQLCNGAFGYLPTEEAEKHSHYSAYVASGHVGHTGGELLVNEALTNIREMFDK